MVPETELVSPSIWTVQVWPTASCVRFDADACRVTVRSGSVSERMGVPGVTGCPAFT